ncbi:hypothetical protein OSB04_012164 [Centaurea solstitialis]|uniref:DUF4371 domain-containing protein n=1 Tax=Centaurea solstitialis TaxID=347529 RepID=A0AA38TAW0_9ASTR|nr:hypothetical protein OSB04_012164 [Centaurea solstitialis]
MDVKTVTTDKFRLSAVTPRVSALTGENVYIVQAEGFNHPKFLEKNKDEPCVQDRQLEHNSVKVWLGMCFTMKDLGEADYILDIKINHDRSKRLIGLSKSTYIDKILKCFKMEGSKRGKQGRNYFFKKKGESSSSCANDYETTKNRKAGLDLQKAGNPHNTVVQKCQTLMNQRQSIAFAFEKQKNSQEHEYWIRLNASIDCVRFLLRQGLAFHGYSENEDSHNKMTNKNKKGANLSSSLLEIIFMDICGPFFSGLGGYKSFITFIDDYSQYTYLYLINDKSNSLNIFKTFKVEDEN